MNDETPYGACSKCGERIVEEEAPLGICEDCQDYDSLEEIL